MSLNKALSKIQEMLDKHFHSIFNNSHFFYTIIFLVALLLISLMSFFQGAGNAIILLATLFSITFLLFMFEGLIPPLDKYLFSTEKRFDSRKGIFFFFNLLISLIIVIPYFIMGNSTQLSIQFLGWDVILPIFYLIIYFGWNLVQILYLRIGFEQISENVNKKVADRYGISKKKEATCSLILILAILPPIIMQVLTLLGYSSYFIPQAGDPVDPLLWFIGYIGFIFILMVITAWRLFTLHLRSKKNDSINAFSSIFYLLIWIIIWFRSFSFINTLQNVVQSSTSLDITTRLIDVSLMVLTTIIVLRGLGDKVYDSIVFNKNNMPFFLFSFTILYFVGQIIMITGAGNLPGIFADRNQINLINNFLIIIITGIFYWIYSEIVLEKEGLIMKKHYYPEDVVLVIKDFKQTLEIRDALNTTKFGDDDLNNFLQLHNLRLPEPEPEEIMPDREKLELEPISEFDTTSSPEPETESEPEPYFNDNDDS